MDHPKRNWKKAAQNSTLGSFGSLPERRDPSEIWRKPCRIRRLDRLDPFFFKKLKIETKFLIKEGIQTIQTPNSARLPSNFSWIPSFRKGSKRSKRRAWLRSPCASSLRGAKTWPTSKGPSLDGMAAGASGTWASCFEPTWRPHPHFTHLYSWESRTLPDEKILTTRRTVALSVLAQIVPFNADAAT